MNKQHSSEFIEEMKTKLLEEQESLETELKALERPEYGRTDEENAAEIADFEASSSMQTTLNERLEGVTEALARIESGTYGVTEAGEAIPEERLRANPAATTLVTKE